MIRVACRTCGSIFLLDDTEPGPWHCPACSDFPLLDAPRKPKPTSKPKPEPTLQESDHGTRRSS